MKKETLKVLAIIAAVSTLLWLVTYDRETKTSRQAREVDLLQGEVQAVVIDGHLYIYYGNNHQAALAHAGNCTNHIK